MGAFYRRSMGALSQHFDEIETKHKLEVGELEMRIIDLETELTIVKGRYEDLCAKIKKNANDNRNEDEFSLTNYNRDGDFWT
ncbi:MAG: hypothetical protein H8D23_30110 [Candidatus Brocadiales bacterium]|nr:hypothetical protein [Candidatus Brocadiales bacterium]